MVFAMLMGRYLSVSVTWVGWKTIAVSTAMGLSQTMNVSARVCVKIPVIIARQPAMIKGDVSMVNVCVTMKLDLILMGTGEQDALISAALAI